MVEIWQFNFYVKFLECDIILISFSQKIGHLGRLKI